MVALLAAVLSSAASADRQIFIPIGNKVPLSSFRLEYMLLDGKHNYDAFATFGLTKEIEAELQFERIGPRPVLGTGSVSYTFFNPVADTIPGISAGVRDIYNRTQFGRFGYVAMTYRLGTEGEMGADYMDVHLGYGYGGHGFPFVGFNLPLSQQLAVMAEHDGVQPTAAIQLQPHPGLQVRWIAREHQTMWSFRWSARF